MFICKTGYTETVISLYHVITYLFPDYAIEHKKQVSFRIYSGLARYIAKQRGKDRKNDHQIALFHHSKALHEREEARSTKEQQP